jgi:hypothetical protein
MAYIRYVKFGLICVAIFEIVSIFFMLHVYNKFVSDPSNYFKNYLTIRVQKELQEK